MSFTLSPHSVTLRELKFLNVFCEKDNLPCYLPDPSIFWTMLEARRTQAEIDAYRWKLLRRRKGPKPAEMRDALKKDPHAVWETDLTKRRIERDGHIIRKSGTEVRVEEARAQQFAFALGIPTPKVHGSDFSGTEGTIVMDYVDGDCLSNVWKDMTPEQKRSIAEQLRDIITTMRKAPYDGKNGIGSVGGPVYDVHRFWVHSGGPFHQEAEFNDFVLNLDRNTPSAIRRVLADALTVNHRIVFSHLDIAPRNIMVKGNRIQALLDWEYAGWFPEHWEYVKAFEQGNLSGDWMDYTDIVFETQYPQELLASQALFKWQCP